MTAATTTTTDDNPHRLNFGHVKHCGRHNALKRLKSLFFESCQAEYPSASSVIVQAASGLGKTALVEAFVEQASSASTCLLVGKGKFEEATAASEPFAAIIGATNDLLQQLAQSEERSLWIQLMNDFSFSLFLADYGINNLLKRACKLFLLIFFPINVLEEWMIFNLFHIFVSYSFCGLQD